MSSACSSAAFYFLNFILCAGVRPTSSGGISSFYYSYYAAPGLRYIVGMFFLKTMVFDL